MSNAIAFAKIEHILPFLHICLSIFLISIQVSTSLLLIFFLKIDNTKKSIKLIFKFLKFFNITVIFILSGVAISGFFLSGQNFTKFSDPLVDGVVLTKYTLGLFVLINFLYILYQTKLMKNSILNNDLEQIEDRSIIISNYFLPLNIVVCLIAVYLGIVIKGF